MYTLDGGFELVLRQWWGEIDPLPGVRGHGDDNLLALERAPVLDSDCARSLPLVYVRGGAAEKNIG